MKDDKIPVRAKKGRQKQNQQKITNDFFTALVKSTLHVDIVREHIFHDKRRWRFDYAIPQYRIALEVEGGVWTGGRHTSPKGFLGDMEKYNTATLLGWRVFRTTPQDLNTNTTIELLQQAILSTPMNCANHICEHRNPPQNPKF